MKLCIFAGLGLFLTFTKVGWAGPADELLGALIPKATTPAEEASASIHQANLLQVFSNEALVKSGFVGSAAEAELFRFGVVYSDYGKLKVYKDWLKTNKLMLAVLQGPNGGMWSESAELSAAKPKYQPLMDMIGGSFLNPALGYQDLFKFFGAEHEPFPNAGFKVPTYHFAIGYLHEVQGLFQSYQDSLLAIEANKGPLAGHVKSLADYRIIFETIFAHNGGGPTRQKYEAWLRQAKPELVTANGNKVPDALIPFWIRAREGMMEQVEKSGVPVFKNTMLSEHYITPKGKLGYVHQSTDRIDGIVNPIKISREVAFLGDREAFVEVYHSGNRYGSILLQQYIADVELQEALNAGTITGEQKTMLTSHFLANRDMGEAVSSARLAKTKFFTATGSEVMAEALPTRIKEVSRVTVNQGANTTEFELSEKGKLLDVKGVVPDFFDFYNKEITNPVNGRAKAYWRVDLMQEMPCFKSGILSTIAST